MMENVPVINKTMELSDCKEKWIFDEKYECWCLEDILYTEKAKVPKFQRLSIFVPKQKMSLLFLKTMQPDICRCRMYGWMDRDAMQNNIWIMDLYI